MVVQDRLCLAVLTNTGFMCPGLTLKPYRTLHLFPGSEGTL